MADQQEHKQERENMEDTRDAQPGTVGDTLDRQGDVVDEPLEQSDDEARDEE